jgi:hypothetical protein
MLFILVGLLLLAIVVTVGKGTINIINIGIFDSLKFEWIC